MILTVSITKPYVIQLWTLLTVITMFDWFVKKPNLIKLNLLGAFLDTCYRLYLQVYGVSYPLKGLFVLILLWNSLLIGREIAKQSAYKQRKQYK